MTAAGLAAVVLLGSLGGGCSRNQTAESACESLRNAVLEADGIAVFEVLLENTQWSVATVQKLHRRMAESIRSSYPAGEQAAALARLYAADSDNGQELFLQLYTERYAADFRARVGEQMSVQVDAAGQASCGAAAARPFPLALGRDGQWGLSELDREWEDAKLRAYHDQETVTKNVELYRRVGAGK